MGIKKIQKDINQKDFLVAKKKLKERMLTTNNNEQDH